MSEPVPNAELLRSLGRLVRGLSALFWGLPVALIICVETAKTDILKSFNIFPALAVTGWLFIGLSQLGHFQKQERIWQNALDRAKVLALVNLGLSPFLYWWNQMPDQTFFTAMMVIMAVSGLLFLSNLNLVLYRLSAMLPDESLREETRHFTALNRYLVLGIMALGLVLVMTLRFPALLPPSLDFLLTPGNWWLIVFLALMPLAMTMTILWKIKEVILESVFGGNR